MQLHIINFTLTGALLMGLAVPLIKRRVKPNRLYGLRTPATFADESVWYEANARSGWDLLYLGVVQIALALLLPLLLGVSATTYLVANLAVMTIGVLAAAFIGWRRANRLLQERR